MSNTKIYTKFGDQGQTRLVDGSCVEKHNPRVEAYGCVDELNSLLGLCQESLFSLQKSAPDKSSYASVLETLFKIQNHLFRIGSILACKDAEVQKKLPGIEAQNYEMLEKEIDRLSLNLEPLRNFILPGGSRASAELHMARTFCRRAERRAAEVVSHENALESHCLIYLNRLSDYFFVLARWSNKQSSISDILWDKNI